MHILIISEYIAPLQAIASLRWTKIAKYIKAAHPETRITVLTNQKSFTSLMQKKDPLLEKDLRAFDEYLQFPSSYLAELYERLKSAGGKKVRQYVLENKYTPQKGWKADAKKALLSAAHDLRDHSLYRKARKTINKRAFDYDVVISTFGPAWPHRLAACLKQRHPQVQWLADFRDPYARDMDDPVSYRQHRRFTMRYCANASLILRVTPDLQTHTPQELPSAVITNGFDPEDALSPARPDHFDVVYTGTLYGEKSDIGIVCKALKELCEEGKADKKDLSVVYVGADEVFAKMLAEKHQAGELLKSTGLVPRDKAIKLQQRAAVLLQAGWNTENERCLWTGKMFEYMTAQKPIVYIMTGDAPYSEPSREIHHLGGCCYEQCRHEETYPPMKAYLLQKYQEWKETGNVSVKQDEDYIKQYSYPQIAEQVYRLIDKNHLNA